MSMDAWTRQEHAKRDRLESALAAAGDPAERARLHAALSDVCKDLGYNHGYGPGLREALDHARAAVELDPDDACHWVRRGRRESKPETSIACYTEALRLGGDDDNAYKERGYAFKNLGYLAAAREDFLRAGEAADGYGSPASEAASLADALADPTRQRQPGDADTLAARMHAEFLASEAYGGPPELMTMAAARAEAEDSPLFGWAVLGVFVAVVLFFAIR